MEHEKYPNCVRLSTVVSVIDDLLVTVDRNTLYIVPTWNYMVPFEFTSTARYSVDMDSINSVDMVRYVYSLIYVDM